MAWTGLTLTVDGRNALNQAQQANTMNIKSVVIGDGAAPSNYSTQKNLVHQLYELTELKVDTTDVGCDITVDFPKVDYDYYFREVGVIVTISGKDILYVYDNCGDDAQYIVNSTGVEENKKRIRLSLAISDVSQITVSTPSTLYVSYDDFETSLGGKLGVSGNASDTVVSFEEPDQNQNLKSGERLSVAFGKIAKAIKTLISHVADKSNPHGVTKEQIGLESVENKSSDDIRSELTTGDIIGALGYIPFNPSAVINNLIIDSEGYALDARQGKVLNDKISEQESAIASHESSITSLESRVDDCYTIMDSQSKDINDLVVGKAENQCITRSQSVTQEGYEMIDAVELNSSVDGTLANKIARALGSVFNISSEGITASIKSQALTCKNGVTFITTGASTTDIPTGYTYGCGLVLRRTVDQLWIVLFKYNAATMAICSYTNGTWSAWSEK